MQKNMIAGIIIVILELFVDRVCSYKLPFHDFEN